MCSNSVTAGALGGIQGTLDVMARNQSRQNNMAGALAQQAHVANHWQAKAFNLQIQLAEWQAWGRKMKAGWQQEEQVSADLRQQLEQAQSQLAQAQEAVRAEKKLRDKEFNEGVEKHNKLVREFNKLAECVNTVKAQPGNAVALITALETELNGQKV